MNRRDFLGATAAACVLPVIPVATAERPVRLFWFGDEETIAARSQAEAEAYMRSLVGDDHFDRYYAGQVREVPPDEYEGHFVSVGDEDGNEWSWSYRANLDHNLNTLGCPVPHYFSSMNA